jgi:hypothetical protein
MYVFYHYDMCNLAVRICNVVATPHYYRLQCNSNLGNVNLTNNK